MLVGDSAVSVRPHPRVGEDAEGEPVREAAFESFGALQRDGALADAVAQVALAHPHFGEGPYVGIERELDVEAWVVRQM